MILSAANNESKGVTDLVKDGSPKSVVWEDLREGRHSASVTDEHSKGKINDEGQQEQSKKNEDPLYWGVHLLVFLVKGNVLVL